MPWNALSDNEQIRSTHNTSRFFVEHPSIAWLLIALIVLWGVFAYDSMPQRKDPKTAVREAMVVTSWPGARAEQVEELVTKRVEAVLGQNDMVTEIRSSSCEGQSVVTFELDEFHAKTRTRNSTILASSLPRSPICPTARGPSSTSRTSRDIGPDADHCQSPCFGHRDPSQSPADRTSHRANPADKCQTRHTRLDCDLLPGQSGHHGSPRSGADSVRISVREAYLQFPADRFRSRRRPP